MFLVSLLPSKKEFSEIYVWCKLLKIHSERKNGEIFTLQGDAIVALNPWAYMLQSLEAYLIKISKILISN